MVFGTFDILHLGHIDLFRQAKQYGDSVVVVVATDERVNTIKGIAPLHSQQERIQLLSQLKLVDDVIAGNKDDVYKVLLREKPDVVALGYDQQVFVDKLESMLDEYHLSETRIVRLEPYKVEKHKSGKIRSYVEKHI